jgi:acyl-CoA thioesterase YciA
MPSDDEVRAGLDPAIRVTAMPADTNAYGDIFGGWLLSMMDSAAGLTAARRAKGRAVTVAMDGMEFHKPVKVGDEVSVYTHIERVGRTSLSIVAEAWSRERHSERAEKVTQAKFTFVAVDDAGRPRPVEESAA